MKKKVLFIDRDGTLVIDARLAWVPHLFLKKHSGLYIIW